jgi:hypothetical protein
VLVELTIYASDSSGTARLLLVHDRLADLLATGQALDVRGARMTALADGRRVAADALAIDLAEVYAVATGEPRGNVGRRVGTIARPALALVGPYEIAGSLHGPPSMDAFEVARRRAWIPLTDAVVTYLVGQREVSLASPVVLVNRRYVAALGPSSNDERPGKAPRGRGGWPTGDDGTGAWGRPRGQAPAGSVALGSLE